RFSRGGEEFVVCAAQGHLYGVSDPAEERVVYPAFDVEWASLDKVEEGHSYVARRVSAIRKLSEGAAKFVNACDFDPEGETIAFNLLRYACGGKEKEALRAKFSTLTSEDLVKAFDEAKPQQEDGLGRAGRARHVIDFVWGVNLSRVLSQSARRPGKRYSTISIGRVQGPTLGFVVKREKEIRTFVPVPFWKVSGTFERGGNKVVAELAKGKVEIRSEAEKVRAQCLSKEAVATSVNRRKVQVGPPVPFNIGELQKEAYRALGFSPSRTMQVAEKLYLGALISYPRTGSQRLPPSMGFRQTIERLGRNPTYSSYATELLKGDLKPVQGSQTDPAHPAIHPTGERPSRQLAPPEAALFDLVVRRFLAAFGESARRELVEARISVGGHVFSVAGARTVFPGWVKYYGRYSYSKDSEVPPVAEGDRFRVADVLVEEKFEQRPNRFNLSSLLEKMEREEIGTKATRADTMATLVARGYVSGQALEATDLGLSVADTMERRAPALMTTELTRQVERELTAVEEGKEDEASLLRNTIRSVSDLLAGLNAEEESVGAELETAVQRTASKSLVLGRCPVCKTGELRVIRSRKTRKRFAGCSNYASGCRATAPLPQRGTIKTTPAACPHCSWPMVVVVGGRRPWKLCVNMQCPGKEGRG
ncbi:MAG TPA: DNA topoisomerase I, partial [Nitrososphaerales archaeon]|nr:DNA topoisomerase I [Nitrososphaerales archaeon]